jgi:hypothetical protein
MRGDDTVLWVVVCARMKNNLQVDKCQPETQSSQRFRWVPNDELTLTEQGSGAYVRALILDRCGVVACACAQQGLDSSLPERIRVSLCMCVCV